MSNITFTKENCIGLLSQYVEHGQASGAFLFKEADLLCKAVDYLNPNVKEKPSFGANVQNPEATAIGLLIQGVTKAQAHGKGAYNLKDASLINQMIEFLTKDNSVTESMPAKNSDSGSNASKRSARKHNVDSDEEQNESDDERTNVISLPSNKGKGRA